MRSPAWKHLAPPNGTSFCARQLFIQSATSSSRPVLEALRQIPELLALAWGDDAGHFEGNFDLVAVMDFADFDSARLYVQHALHQAYIRDHAAKVVGERVIVQHVWNPPPS